MTTTTEPITDNGPRNNKIRLVALVIIAGLAALGAWYYFVAFRPYETTDDAFIDGRAFKSVHGLPAT